MTANPSFWMSRQKRRRAVTNSYVDSSELRYIVNPSYTANPKHSVGETA